MFLLQKENIELKVKNMAMTIGELKNLIKDLKDDVIILRHDDEFFELKEVYSLSTIKVDLKEGLHLPTYTYVEDKKANAILL